MSICCHNPIHPEKRRRGIFMVGRMVAKAAAISVTLSCAAVHARAFALRDRMRLFGDRITLSERGLADS